MGICKVTAQAQSVGITAIPGPISEMNWDGWLWHQFISLHDADANVASGASSFQRVDIDSKAMRIFDPEDVIVAMLEVTEIGTAEMDVFLDIRMLFKQS